MRVDVADDRFDVAFDPEAVGPETMVERIRDLGYEPEIVETGTGVATVEVERISVSGLPKPLQAKFTEAERRGVSVLLDFTAPG